jgi:multicomponent Na+:H+ antiporter subunit F
MTAVVNGVLVALSMGFFLCFFRVVAGPTLPDRVVALDLASTIAVALLAVYALSASEPAVLDAALMVALVGFLGTIGFATHVNRGNK